MAKVSVVIATYNRAQHLRGAINSVLQQTYTDYEILVVDDGSVDETADVVREYSREPLRYVYQPNGGSASARNRGLRMSSGDYIAFIDDDDRWLPEKLELQVDKLGRDEGVELRLPAPLRAGVAGHVRPLNRRSARPRRGNRPSGRCVRVPDSASPGGRE